MTGMELLQVAALVVGVGSPVATLIHWKGSISSKLTSIETTLSSILEKEGLCQSKRETVEDAIQSRVTAIQDRVARIEGRQNGRSERHVAGGNHG